MFTPSVAVHRAYNLFQNLAETSSPGSISASESEKARLRTISDTTLTLHRLLSHHLEPSRSPGANTPHEASAGREIGESEALGTKRSVVNRKRLRHAIRLAEEVIDEDDHDEDIVADLYFSSLHYFLSALQPCTRERYYARITSAIERAGVLPKATWLINADGSNIPQVTLAPLPTAACTCGGSISSPHTPTELLIAGLISLGIAIKRSQIPHILSNALHALAIAALAINARFRLSHLALIFLAATAERLVLINSELGLHRVVADAIVWLMEVAITVLVAVSRAEVASTVDVGVHGLGLPGVVQGGSVNNPRI